MSQIEVNTNFNSVNVENVINTIDVNQDISNILVIPQEITNVVEIVTPGPKGDKGEPGDPSLFTSSFVGTASFFAFTQSYYEDSASFSASISQLQTFSSSLDATFATDAELNAATASLSASINILSSSFLSFSSSYNTGSFSGSFIGNGSGIVGVISSSYSNNSTSASYALTASYAISSSQAINSDTSSFQTNIQFAESHIPFFDSDNSMSSSAMRQWQSESITINAEFGTGANPEALFVFQPSTESINIITAEADVDNYVQFNLFNRNSGSTASSDIVATADNGNEFINFINMGINSSTFTGSVGGPNDAYLYSTGNDLTIGNATANKHIRFFTGGGLVDVYQKFVLNPDDLHELTGSLSMSGSISFEGGSVISPSGPYIDIIAGPGGWAELQSNDGNQYMWVDDTGSYIGTDWLTNAFLWTFDKSGSLKLPITSTGSILNNDGSLYTASFAISASHASNAINSNTSSFQTNIQFLENYVPLFDSNNSISSSAIHQSGSNSIIINREFNTANAPEALFVFQPDLNSFNIITAEGNVDNYFQINIKNENSGSTSSADVVATADNGDEFVNFINMGINSSTFTGSVGGPNDAYLYSTGNDLTIGNATANKHVRFFTGGGLVDVYQKLVLNPDDLHELTGSLFVHNGFIYSNVTGSLEGTASFAASASYAATSSYASNFTVANTLTATTLVVQTVSSSVVYSSGSNIFGNDLSNTQEFTGSVTITGSLFVNNSAAILTNQTSSMSVLSASYALTSSYALNAELLDGLDSAAFTLTSSFNNFTSSYNTGSFTGSFIGDGSGLLGVISASYSLTASFIDGGIY